MHISPASCLHNIAIRILTCTQNVKILQEIKAQKFGQGAFLCLGLKIILEMLIHIAKV